MISSRSLLDQRDGRVVRTRMAVSRSFHSTPSPSMTRRVPSPSAMMALPESEPSPRTVPDEDVAVYETDSDAASDAMLERESMARMPAVGERGTLTESLIFGEV